MATKTKRPTPMRVGDVVVRVVRARGARGPQDGRWYWQARVFKERGRDGETVWNGWGTSAEVVKAIAGLVSEQGAAPERPATPAQPTTEVVTAEDLLSVWVAKVEREADAGSVARGTAASYRICARRLPTRSGSIVHMV
jgi:hypothetical protein